VRFLLIAAIWHCDSRTGLTFAVCSPSMLKMGDDRSKNALLIAASLIAAVRLAREEIKPTPRVLSAVGDSIRLARMVLAGIERESN
jgi:hypothetical protein